MAPGLGMRYAGTWPLGDVMGDGAHPAVFEGKALKRVSTCPWHPKYQAKREPRGPEPCARCLAIWNAEQGRKQ